MSALLTLADLEKRLPGGIRLFESPGPIADAFVESQVPVALINGPQGSAKTTSCIRKIVGEARRMPPGPDGVRRYVPGIWRHKFGSLWASTIPSWWKIFPKDYPTKDAWTGSAPRQAEHVIRFQDGWGVVEITARFHAFGEAMDPADLRGLEFTDVWLNEWDTLPEDAFTYLAGRVGRAPPPETMGRQGRIFGDCNAPDVLSYVYRDFWQTRRPGYHLFRQPGGLEPDAENIKVLGRGYYEQQAMLNAHRPWWVRRMIDNKPGFTRDHDIVYPTFDDERMVSPRELQVFPEIPVLVGVDGGLTPAAAFLQQLADGQVRAPAEIALERGDEGDLGEAMLAMMARPRFRGCEFVVVADPATGAGDGTSNGSFRSRLAKKLGLEVRLASSNVPTTRIQALKDPIEAKRFLIDGVHCPRLRRGFSQTYHYHRVRGTDDRSSVVKTPDSHVVEAAQYAAMELGTSQARHRRTALLEERRRRQEEGRAAGRYSPFRRRA